MSGSADTATAVRVQSFSPRLLELRSAIAWLMEIAGVSAPMLSNLFETSAENIRKLKYLAARQLEPSLLSFIPSLDLVPSTAMHRSVGLRSHREILRRSDRSSATFGWLKDQVERRFDYYSATYDFHAGAKSLAQLKQKLGHISDSRRMAVAGLLEQRLAWFLVHSGLARSAVSHASTSLWLLQAAHYRLNGKEEVRQFVNSCLIASHANLLSARPAAALHILDLARDAAVSIGDAVGSDHFRQRGVALFQMGARYDDQARDNFNKAADQMRRLNEASSEAQVLMTGQRQKSLLGKPDWDNAERVLEAAESTFAPGTLELSMNRHWAAATGLLIENSRINQRAVGLLESNSSLASRFGHQATVTRLLSITPELPLPRGLKALWIRKVLYQNAFRFK